MELKQKQSDHANAGTRWEAKSHLRSNKRLKTIQFKETYPSQALAHDVHVLQTWETLAYGLVRIQFREEAQINKWCFA